MLHEHFELTTGDPDWLAEVGKRGWVVLTKDQRIRRRRAEFHALLDAGVAAFVLTSGNMTGKSTADAFVRAYPRIRKLVRDCALPFVAGVDARGNVKLLTAALRHAARKKEAMMVASRCSPLVRKRSATASCDILDLDQVGPLAAHHDLAELDAGGQGA